MRESGILLPVSALPSTYGIGCFSKEAYEFVDRLVEAGQTCWQILPLGPTSYGDSPYQSFSTFAGNPYYIDLEAFIEKGWLTRERCDACDFGGSDEYVDYEKIYNNRFALLREAWQNSNIRENPDFRWFVGENAYWLEDYALYMAVKASFGNTCWIEWDEDIRRRWPEAIDRYRGQYWEEMEFYKFQQYFFFDQWWRLKHYANERGIQIIGDIPIYVAFDSADAWANPFLFQFDWESKPVSVAGCPPDAFSETGQLWGNPLYSWSYHRETGYDWWMKRLERCFAMYDVVRIDHFRAFDEYYAIPAGAETAETGQWEPGPGYELFEVMKNRLGERRVIAEDLGFLTPTVLELVEQTGYPGMKILQFAFDAEGESAYLPHKYQKNCVVYTGTHDNETTYAWYETLSEENKEFCDKYLQLEGCSREEVVWKMIRAAISSVADLAIIPMQDYLCKGAEARINTPSTLGNNWKWRMKRDAFSPELSEKIRDLATLYGRVPKPEKSTEEQSADEQIIEEQ